MTVDKAAGAPLGLELASAVFDRVRTCDNHCPFCFIHQLPKGMRRSLYLKDDDYRLSFLYGNFTTLTRFTEADLERVITEQLRPALREHPRDRSRAAGAPAAQPARRHEPALASALLDAGIEVHGQVVVCPGINDGAVLDDTLLGVLDRFPELATVGVVPLGVSDHTTEPEMRPHTRAEAERGGRHRRSVAGALLRRARPPARVRRPTSTTCSPGARSRRSPTTTSCSQHENGIGMARTFEPRRCGPRSPATPTEVVGTRSGFFAWVDGAPAEGYRAPRTSLPGRRRRLTATPVRVRRPGHAPVSIVTGEFGARVLAPLVADLADRGRRARAPCARCRTGSSAATSA